MAAIAKRDTYSELSYLTNEHRLGKQFLNWLYDKVTDSNYKRDAWWAVRAFSRPCSTWIFEWQTLYLPRAVWAVSGMVSSDLEDDDC
jgi:hypothetical protein